MTHRFPIKRHNVNQVFYRTSRTIEKSKLNFITLCQVNYLLKDFKTFENILRPVDWTMAYDNCIRKNFPEISEVRSAWANQDAEYWMRMFDKGSHWSSIQGLKIGKIVVNIFDAFFLLYSESHKLLRWIIKKICMNFSPYERLSFLMLFFRLCSAINSFCQIW